MRLGEGVVLLLLASCERSPRSQATPATPPPAPSAVATTSSSPGAAVIVTNGAPGSFSVHAGSVAATLSTHVDVEREVDGGFVLAGTSDVVLTAACDAKLATGGSAPPCIALAAGETLTPPPWTGMSCASQCNLLCHFNAPVTPGNFRFVVRSCDGKQRFEGPTFTMTAPR